MQAQRVFNKAQRVMTKEQRRQEITPTEIPDLEIAEISNLNNNRNQGAMMILQEDNDNDDYIQPPAANTHQQQQSRTLMQEYMLHMMELPGTKTAPFNPQQAASHKYPLQFLCNFANAVLDNETGDLLKYWHLIKCPKYKATWSNSFGTEIQRLATTTETIFFVDKKEIPQDRQQDITYGRICCNYCEQKKDAYWTRITMGGNSINYPGDCGTPTAGLLTIKLLLNSIISTLYTKFMCIDIKYFIYAHQCHNTSISG